MMREPPGGTRLDCPTPGPFQPRIYVQGQIPPENNHINDQHKVAGGNDNTIIAIGKLHKTSLLCENHHDNFSSSSVPGILCGAELICDFPPYLRLRLLSFCEKHKFCCQNPSELQVKKLLTTSRSKLRRQNRPQVEV